MESVLYLYVLPDSEPGSVQTSCFYLPSQSCGSNVSSVSKPLSWYFECEWHLGAWQWGSGPLCNLVLKSFWHVVGDQIHVGVAQGVYAFGPYLLKLCVLSDFLDTNWLTRISFPGLLTKKLWLNFAFLSCPSHTVCLLLGYLAGGYSQRENNEHFPLAPGMRLPGQKKRILSLWVLGTCSASGALITTRTVWLLGAGVRKKWGKGGVFPTLYHPENPLPIF